MNIEILKSKIHRVKVTGADLNYIGSITIDKDLMDAANILEGEKIYIVNNNNGERFVTYVIPGSRGSGEINVNGAAARKVNIGDILILISYVSLNFEEAKKFKPTIIFPNEENNLLT
tara:strand:- start:448 stop:798 length:351 start_codon:yes stop_codon:yes gene_type:complete